MTTRLYELTFEAPVHFGEDSSGLERSQEFLHSDTLFSAVCYGWAAVYGGPALQNDLMLEPLAGDAAATIVPPLILSSAFIFSHNTYFLPKPMIPLSDADRTFLLDRPELAKKVKESRFLPVQLWRRWLELDPSNRKCPIFIDNDTDMAAVSEYKTTYHERLLVRNRRPRAGGDTTPYICSGIVYSEGCGLYFLARFSPEAEDSGLPAKFETVLDFLADNGIGGERSSGYGVFKCHKKTGEEFDPTSIFGNLDVGEDPAGYVLLSVASPQLADDQTLEASGWAGYDMVRRRGYPTPLQSGTGSKRRQNLIFLIEGSAFRGAIAPSGRVWKVLDGDIDSKSDYPIYRSGLALAWPYRV